MTVRTCAAGIAALALSACTSGAVGQYPITRIDPATNGRLQLAVGWATQYPSNPPETTLAGYGINFVETFRQPNGRSAVLGDSPEIDLSTALATELGNAGAPSNVQFTSSTPALGAGLVSPAALDSNSLYSPISGTGGPPAFPAPADSTSVTQQFSEGYYAAFPIVAIGTPGAVGDSLVDALQVFPGQYTLNVTIPTGQKSSELVSASATLTGKPLPVFVPPAVVADGNGGALVTITIPAGVTETIVTVLGVACQTQPSTGSTPATVLTRNEVYTLLSHAAGPGTDRLTLPDSIVPVGGLGAYQSLCPAADYAPGGAGYSVYAVGFDYPAFESVYPQSFSQTPTIANATGQADVTISAVTSFTTP